MHRENPDEWAQFKDRLKAIASDSLCISLCTPSLWCSFSFLHLTLSCLNLLLKWRLSWAAGLLIWQLWISIQWKTHWKTSTHEEQPPWQDVDAYFYQNWKLLWGLDQTIGVCLYLYLYTFYDSWLFYVQKHIDMLSRICCSMLTLCFCLVNLKTFPTNPQSNLPMKLVLVLFSVISTAETSAAIPIQLRSMAFDLWPLRNLKITFEKLDRKCLFPETISLLLRLIHRLHCEKFSFTAICGRTSREK